MQDQRLDQWNEIWKERVKGKSNYEIAKKFGLSITNVRNVLAACRKECIGSRKGMVEEEMHLDLSRCDDIIANYTPVAAAMTVMVQRMNANGDAYTTEEWNYPMHAAKIILDAIKMRAAILGYGKETGTDKGLDSDSLLWVRRASEAKVVNVSKAEPVNNQDSSLDLSWPE